MRYHGLKKHFIWGCLLCLIFVSACDAANEELPIEEETLTEGWTAEQNPAKMLLPASAAQQAVDGWTDWLNRDYPSGTGDWEVGYSDPCGGNEPIQIMIETVNGVPYQDTGETLHVVPSEGAWCINAEQPDGECENYHVKFLCSSIDSVEYISPSAFPEVETWTPSAEIDASHDYAIMPHLIPNIKTGHILQTIAVTTAHEDFHSRIAVLRISKDGGETWHGPNGTGDRNIVDFLGDGRTVDISGGASTPSGRFVLFFRAFSNGSYVGNYFSYSDDDGATWSTPTSQGAMGHYMHDTRFLLGEEGELIYSQAEGSSAAGARKLVTYHSFDDGESWQKRSTVFSPEVENFTFGEPVMRDFGSGLFILISRSANHRISSGEFAGLDLPMMFTSRDYAKTWANGIETVTESQLDNGDVNAGWLPLEGTTQTLGDGGYDNALPYIEYVKYNGQEYILIGYYLRHDVLPSPSGDDEVLRLTAIRLDEWLDRGWQAIKAGVAVTVYEADNNSQGQYDGNGSLFVPGNRPEALFSLCDNTGRTSGSPELVRTGRINENIITDILDELETAEDISH